MSLDVDSPQKFWASSRAPGRPTTLVRVFVIGIDPGLSRCGYACLEVRRRQHRAVAAGVIRTDTGWTTPERLHQIQLDIRGLLAEYRPVAVAVERVLFQTNVRTAMGVGMASGIVMAEAVAMGCVVVEYSPNEVKEAVAGWGAATKDQVSEMTSTLLGLDTPLRPADAADAAAIALCHLARHPAGTPGARLAAGTPGARLAASPGPTPPAGISMSANHPSARVTPLKRRTS